MITTTMSQTMGMWAASEGRGAVYSWKARKKRTRLHIGAFLQQTLLDLLDFPATKICRVLARLLDGMPLLLEGNEGEPGVKAHVQQVVGR
jgi:hypothetical protein